MKNVRILGILLFTVTNNVDRIQVILFLISFSFYFKKLLLNKLSDEGTISKTIYQFEKVDKSFRMSKA